MCFPNSFLFMYIYCFGFFSVNHFAFSLARQNVLVKWVLYPSLSPFTSDFRRLETWWITMERGRTLMIQWFQWFIRCPKATIQNSQHSYRNQSFCDVLTALQVSLSLILVWFAHCLLEMFFFFLKLAVLLYSDSFLCICWFCPFGHQSGIQRDQTNYLYQGRKALGWLARLSSKCKLWEEFRTGFDHLVFVKSNHVIVFCRSEGSAVTNDKWRKFIVVADYSI